MTRNGLVEENLATKETRKVTNSDQELPYKQKDVEQAFITSEKKKNSHKKAEKKQFSEKVNEYVVYAPDVAHRARAGQFIILRATEDGERVPFTVCDYDREKGTITILVQTVGYSTMILEKLSVGDSICDFVGPLGKPTDLSGFDKILLVGGGIGSAVIYPQAKQLMLENKAADVIVGARNESLVIYENDFKKFSNEFFVMTDDGSAGEKGFVTDKIKNLLDEGRKYDCIFAVGPLPMMKAVCALTKKYGVKTIVSMNTIMVAGKLH